ncbi:MAG: nitrogen regulation protein NR(II) [Gammaproteobacteria bacterium]
MADPRPPAAADYLESLATAVVVVDRALRVTYANPSAEQLLGISLQQLAGRSLPLAVPALAPLEPLLRQALHTGQGFARRGLVVATPGAAETSPVIDCALSVAEGSGAEPEVLLELVDSSRRLRVDRENALLSQLQASRSMVRQLAHELRNPLGGIRGAAQLLNRQLASQAQKDYTGLIIREADRLAALTTALLGPDRSPSLEQVNIHELVEHVRKLAKAEAGDGVSVDRDYDPSLPRLRLDKDQVIQAMLNIARNALVALDGRGHLVFRTRALTNETIGSRSYRLVACVEIEDDGPGVPVDLRDTLFYPLVTGREGGSGLGLAVAQDLVGRHGGLIEFASRPGRTVFRMLFPIEEAAT